METENKNGLFFSARQVSLALSVFIVVSFFAFISGYFLGKRKAADKFYNKITQDSFADQIYYSVCSMYESDSSCVDQESTEDSQESIEDSSECLELAEQDNAAEDQEALLTVVDQKIKTDLQEEKKYYAELIGFGTLRCANKFAAKLKNRGFSVVVKKRRSKTSRGKTIVWYQVISEKFENKNDLIAFVDIIKEKERLKGIRIIEC